VKTGHPPKAPLYVLPHGIEVIGEYPARGKNRYWRVRIRPHRFFPDAPVVSNGIYVRRSRVVLASKLGRALTPAEHAHHRDEDRNSDVPGNVELLTAAEHNRHHKTGSKHTAASRAKTSETLKRMYAAGVMTPHPTIGSRQWCAKLTEESATSIKHSTERTAALVKKHGVSRTVIKQIRSGKIWRHVA
jgi:hypothetical protein